ncbi:MAG: hypothetical protein KH828_05900 [Clostridiales bacterium]|nr:hypothetical protein [Clostridiales bacterium]
MRKIKKGSALVLVFALTLSTIGVSRVQAAIGIETEKSCSLSFELDAEFPELKELEIPVKLYKVADVAEDGTYTELAGFEELKLGSISEETTAEEWGEKAETANGVIEAAPDKEWNEKEVTIKAGVGTAADLATGMYLVTAETVESDWYFYDFTPYLISLPNNYYYTPAEGQEPDDTWKYGITVGLKPAQRDRFGDLVIDKTLTSYNATLGGASFVFQVEAVKDGEKVYSDVVSLVFDGTGTKSVQIDDIPAGAVVTVKEIYSGSSYTATSATEQTTTIIADEEAGNPVSVGFTNEYNHKLNGGASVVNHLTYADGELGWEKQDDSTGVQE